MAQTEDTTKRPHDSEIPVKIDHKPYKAPKSVMTAAELRVLADPDISSDYDLFREVQGPGDDIKLTEGEGVELEPGMHFYSVLRQINPGARNAIA